MVSNIHTPDGVHLVANSMNNSLSSLSLSGEDRDNISAFFMRLLASSATLDWHFWFSFDAMVLIISDL